jgi:hypothetical protein
LEALINLGHPLQKSSKNIIGFAEKSIHSFIVINFRLVRAKAIIGMIHLPGKETLPFHRVQFL